MKNQNDFFKTPAEIFKNMQEMAELQDYANKQFEVISSLKQQVDQLTVENTHLKQLLSNSNPTINLNPLTDEELICLEQIRKLKEQSKGRELTLDEVKKLDLLHKNLKMTRENNMIDVTPKKKESASTEKLLAIVAKKANDGE